MNGYKYHCHITHGLEWDGQIKVDKARIWCEEMFGEEYTNRWGLFIDGFNFNNEQDYMWFLLRWSGEKAI